jgi:predicted nucleic acid-binding protein
VKPFLDTNVLVYAVLSDDPRRPTAERLLAAGGTISVQVLNEFANVARGKLKWPWRDIEATLALVRSRSGRVRDISTLTHESALALARDHSLAFYDALIVAAAIDAGCDTLFTEDMQHGRTFGNLAIVNPFLERVP